MPVIGGYTPPSDSGLCVSYIVAADWIDQPVICDTVTEDDGVLYSLRASEVMYVLLGRQFPGACVATVRPQRSRDCSCIPSFTESLYGGASCVDDGIVLHDPVRSINEVKINGAVFTGWYLTGRRILRRSDGFDWPTFQNLGLPDSATGTFSINYTFGATTPSDVDFATADLAAYLYALDHPPATSKAYPQGTTGVSRQGQSVTVTSDVERARQAGPSLPSVTTAIATYNPENRRVPSDVFSPDDIWDLILVDQVGA